MNKVSMTGKCHDHTLQTNPRHREEETENTTQSHGNKKRFKPTFMPIVLSHPYQLDESISNFKDVRRYSV